MGQTALPYDLTLAGISRARAYRWIKLAGAASVPVSGFIVLLLMSFDLPLVLDSPLILLVLNTLFVTLVSVIVAIIAARSFLLSGLATLLLLGCAALAFGVGSFVAGLVIGTVDGANDAITVHNSAALISAIFHFVGAAFVSFGPAYRRVSGSRRLALLVEYGGVLVLIAIISIASLWGDAPKFFIQGEGATLPRQLVLGSAVVLFGCASALFFRVYFKSRSELAFWHSLALALLAIGLWSIYPASALSNALNWFGRGIQYLGSLYMLFAILSMRVTQGSRLPLEQALTSFFVEAKENYQALVEASTNAIVAIDEDGFVLLWNRGAERIFGYTEKEALGTRLAELIVPPGPGESVWRELTDFKSSSAASFQGATREMEARRKSGGVFPFEFDIAARVTMAGWIGTFIGRDISRRKRAEEGRRLSEERLNVALKNTPVVVCSNDRELRYTWVENFSSDYASEEILGHTDAELFPAAEAERLMAIKRTVIETGAGTHTEFAVTTRHGIQHFDVTIDPLADQDGHVVGINCVAVNVTDLKRLADQVNAERARWQATVEAVPDAVLVADAQGKIVYANPASASLLDMGGPDVPSATHRPTLYRTDGSVYAAHDLPLYRAAVEGIEVRNAEVVRVTPDGKQRTVLWNAGPIREGNGKVIGAVSIGHDVTVERRIEKERERLLLEVEEEREKLQTLVESIVDEIWFCDAAGNVTLMNPAAIGGVGITGETSIDQVLDGVGTMTLDGNKRRREDAALYRSLQGQVVRNEEHRVQHKESGEWHYRLVSSAPIHDSAGKIVGAVAIARDITAIKQVERRIEELNSDLERRATELESANRELESFSYSVSHDLRTPLSTIDSFSRLLLADYGSLLPPSGQRYMQLIRDNTVAMNRLIEDLLFFSRTSRQPLKKQTVAMESLVRQAVDELRPSYIGRRVEFTIGDLPPCRGDSVLVKQVWTNLLTNSLKFTRKREHAQIEIGSVPGYGDQVPPGCSAMTSEGTDDLASLVTRDLPPVTYYVRDNGVGFDAEQADKLFGVFQRFHSEEEYEGTGVGLAIVERIVRRHGGKVWAESEVDKGAAFYFTIGA